MDVCVQELHAALPGSSDKLQYASPSTRMALPCAAANFAELFDLVLSFAPEATKISTTSCAKSTAVFSSSFPHCCDVVNWPFLLELGVFSSTRLSHVLFIVLRTTALRSASCFERPPSHSASISLDSSTRAASIIPASVGSFCTQCTPSVISVFTDSTTSHSSLCRHTSLERINASH